MFVVVNAMLDCAAKFASMWGAGVSVIVPIFVEVL